MFEAISVSDFLRTNMILSTGLYALDWCVLALFWAIHSYTVHFNPAISGSQGIFRGVELVPPKCSKH